MQSAPKKSQPPLGRLLVWFGSRWLKHQQLRAWVAPDGDDAPADAPHRPADHVHGRLSLVWYWEIQSNPSRQSVQFTIRLSAGSIAQAHNRRESSPFGRQANSAV